MLPRCSAGFIIDVEPFSSQFNSAQHLSILCYLLYAFYLCKKLTCTNFVAQLDCFPLIGHFFLFLVWPRLADSSHHQNLSKLWNRLKKFKGYRKKQQWLQDECSMWRGPTWRLSTLHLAWFSLYLKQIGWCNVKSEIAHMVWISNFTRDAPWPHLFGYLTHVYCTN